MPELTPVRPRAIEGPVGGAVRHRPVRPSRGVLLAARTGRDQLRPPAFHRSEVDRQMPDIGDPLAPASG